MAKTIIKELIITLLLCLVIILLLGVLLYDYVPMAKTIPNEVSYTTPTNVKEDLAEENVEKEIIKSYEINSDDLNNFKRVKNYKPGKANPFSSYELTDEDTTGNNETGGNGGSSGTTNNNSGSSTTSGGGKFFQNKGTK